MSTFRCCLLTTEGHGGNNDPVIHYLHYYIFYYCIGCSDTKVTTPSKKAVIDVPSRWCFRLKIIDFQLLMSDDRDNLRNDVDMDHKALAVRGDMMRIDSPELVKHTLFNRACCGSAVANVLPIHAALPLLSSPRCQVERSVFTLHMRSIMSRPRAARPALASR